MAFYEHIKAQVKDLDIGLLVLNAGCSNEGFFSALAPEQLQEMLDTNCYHVVALMHMFTQTLLARKARSGLILNASIAAEVPGGKGFFTYCATKAFVKYLAGAISMETNKKEFAKVDI